MRKLRKPSDVPAEVFILCVTGVRNAALKARFLEVMPDIQAASDAFEAAASAEALYTLEAEEEVAGIVTEQEMSALYDSRMAKLGAPGRRVYDKLMMLTQVCPLCGHRMVSTLDHHLPKSKFPALAVTPVNLIPACGDCNKKKLDSSPRTAGEQTFHPYFDDFGQDAWLHAEVVEQSPPMIRFSVRPPGGWPVLWGVRARHHFQTFQLGKLYTVQAGQELVNMRHHLMKLLEKAGADEVRAHVREQAASREAANPNSWQTAMYKALSANEWFCREGLAHIPSKEL
jgi:hypothetical protein